jgi:hypothetical protein
MHDRLELPRSHLSRDGCQICHLMLVPQEHLPVLSLSVMRKCMWRFLWVFRSSPSRAGPFKFDTLFILLYSSIYPLLLS